MRMIARALIVYFALCLLAVLLFSCSGCTTQPKPANNQMCSISVPQGLEWTDGPAAGQPVGGWFVPCGQGELRSQEIKYD